MRPSPGPSLHGSHQPPSPTPLIGVKIHKADPSIRIGISFEKEEYWPHEGALVRDIHPYGLATQAGLKVGDVVLSINRVKIDAPLVAASILRDSEGDIWLTVMRRDMPCFDEAIDGDDDGLHASPLREMRHCSTGSCSVPSLSVGKVTEWQRKTHQQGVGPSDEFDLGQITQRALSGMTTLLTGRRPEEKSVPPPSWLGGLGHALGALLQSKDHQAATRIASAYRRRRAIGERLRRQCEEEHAALILAEKKATALLSMHAAAVCMQRWVRGFIDRTWVRMVREEVANLQLAAEEAEAEAQARYSQKTNRRDKVKRAFSFSRKQQRAQPPIRPLVETPSISELLCQGGHIPSPTAYNNSGSSSSALGERPAQGKENSGSTLGAFKRSFSWGRRSKVRSPALERGLA